MYPFNVMTRHDLKLSLLINLQLLLLQPLSSFCL